VRTERGRQILRKAMAAGYVQLAPATAANVLAAQSSLLSRRTEIFGRLVGLKAFGIPVPHFTGFSLFAGWQKLPMTRKAKTILGTAKRVIRRRLYVRPNRTSDVAVGTSYQSDAVTDTDNQQFTTLKPHARAAVVEEDLAQPTTTVLTP
jgi:hypothetical protein